MKRDFLLFRYFPTDAGKTDPPEFPSAGAKKGQSFSPAAYAPEKPPPGPQTRGRSERRRGGPRLLSNKPRNAAEVARNKERRIAPALLGSILRGEKYRILRAAVLGSRRLERRLSYAKPNFPAIMILAQSFAYVKV